MPHTRSAAKNIRKSEKRRKHNRAVISTIKVLTKKFEATVASGNAEAAKKEFVIVVKKLDKAAAKRVVHPNLAARKKSQLARMLNKKPAAKTNPAKS
jgi:small subunit ribosomal protein S20